uniref:Ionotropic receptor 75a N-terminal domain-containing protein n=1 Tax=Anopheles minimus TaxID=112268 RepID=A0A182VQS7_9DIPT
MYATIKYWMFSLLSFAPSLAWDGNERLVVDLVNWHHLRVVYVFHCFNHHHYEFVHLVHSVRKNCPQSMSFVNVASFSEEKFVTSLEPVHVRVGLMVDMHCQGVNSVLPILAERGYFNGERYRWFLFGLRAVEENRMILQQLNITASANTGSWSMAAGFTMWDNRSVYETQLNLFGMQLSGIKHEYGVALENVPEMVEFLNATEDKYLLTLVQTQQARTSTMYYDLKDGIPFILERGRNAFVCDANRAYQLIQHHFTDEQRCALQVVPLTDKLSTHLALRKDHPLKEQFRVTVQKIIATSMVQYERQRCYADKPRCAENEVKMPEVNLDQVSSVLVLLLGTIIGSIGVLLLEITVSKVLLGRH